LRKQTVASYLKVDPAGNFPKQPRRGGAKPTGLPATDPTTITHILHLMRTSRIHRAPANN
jgi:hypothetical protein